jgi:uncharacterized protein YjcR
MKENLKKFSKWLLLLPITIIGFIIYRLLIPKSTNQKATKSLIDAVKKNSELLSEQKKNEEKANQEKQKADEIAKKIEKIKQEEGDLEWHLKIKKD